MRLVARSVSLTCLAAAELLGCDPPPDASRPLSDILPEATLTLEQATGGRQYAYLLPVKGTDSGVCFAVQSSVRAELNGTSLDVTDPGGWKTTRGNERYCTYPLFDVRDPGPSAAEAPVDELEIRDESASAVLVVSDFTAQHPIVLSDPADAKVRAGQTIVLTSRPPSEAAVSSLVRLFSEHPTATQPNGGPLPEFSYEDEKAPGGNGEHVSFDVNNVRVPLAPGLPEGPAHLAGNIGLELPIEQCMGPQSCTVKFIVEFDDLSVEVVR